ncbi:hypothetical protein F3Y22_tig00000329pilonHSYRG00395 [Hibiscus syriacus]|uniref:Uncharacterized protein n=1 Tax=Hibiscus syriacus TaxID=106335 RepID=A0A6A3D2A0_HIBSY|nr:hypothetical protein F3Y22_tig00000329pilonHSYRG00395 [Hibiscus syriacus]
MYIPPFEVNQSCTIMSVCPGENQDVKKLVAVPQQCRSFQASTAKVSLPHRSKLQYHKISPSEPHTQLCEVPRADSRTRYLRRMGAIPDIPIPKKRDVRMMRNSGF